VVNFTPKPLHPRGKSPRYPSDRKLGGAQIPSEYCGEKNITLNCISTTIFQTETKHG